MGKTWVAYMSLARFHINNDIVCVTSTKLNDTSDKEMLAIVAALRHWYHYLAFTKYPINIYSDHRNLQYFMMPRAWNPPKPGYTICSRNDFKIHWLPSKAMTTLCGN
ncbi:hypothetical protein CspHIS471_0607940 [Cutaneotrichosporon sp. HIS471]|nr:hypothetical protein CspHIS471_0607940 [Cutaneotrichosporon sp. HIS471]